MKIGKILVPTDFSEGATSACDFATVLAQQFQSKIDLFHVVPSLKYIAESIKNLGLPFDMDRDLYPQMVKQAKEMMEEHFNKCIDKEHRGQAQVVVDRKPFEDIIRKAVEDQCDLIVMGARGRHDDGILNWGSVTAKVVRHSPVPVLTIPTGIGREGVNKILYPTDLSPRSLSGLAMTAEMAAIMRAEITIFHVMEAYDSGTAENGSKKGKTRLEKMDEHILKSIELMFNSGNDSHITVERVKFKLYDHLLVDLGGKKYTVRFMTRVVKGVSAHYEIIEYAGSEHFDLIVMGTHGRSGLKYLFLGSTSEKVAQHARIPVLIYRSMETEIEEAGTMVKSTVT